MKDQLSPVLLFTYNRPYTLKKTVAALQKNFLADKSRLYIFSDAAKSDKDAEAVQDVRTYIDTIRGFLDVEVIKSPWNKGLADSIITGASRVINEYGKVIVLEDDLVSSPNFLSFVNQALNYYHDYEKVFSISGFTMPMKNIDSDTYFTRRSSSWGWGTWKEKWNEVDWDVKDYRAFSKNEAVRMEFNKMGSDLSAMLDKQMRGKINSWAIRWCYHQFKHDLYTLYPALSKITNIGLESPDATHTREKFSRFKTILDDTGKTYFTFNDHIELNPRYIRQFVKPYSISQRVKYKLLNSLSWSV